MDNPQIGWVGLGNMGNAIVQNLLKKGFIVNVYNRTKEKEASLVQAGARSQDSLQQLVHNSSIIFTMVSDDAAVKEIFSGHEGLLNHSPSGKIFVDMSTVSPETSRHLAQICNESHNEFIEAPVSGSVQPAKEGALVVLAAGPAETFEKAKTVLNAIGKRVVYLGNNGAGSAAKLAINYFLGVNLQALAETVLFAQQNGIKPEDMLTIINEGALANGITKGKGPAILSNQFPAAFALKHLAKDLRLADELGLQTPLFQPVLNSFQQALQIGLGDQDVMAIFTYLQENGASHPQVENLYPDDNVSDYAN